MKAERKILTAFILNLAFSIFEFVGGFLTGSIAVASDAVHDLGDCVSIGLSAFFERKASKAPNEKYTYGYIRFSVLGGLITSAVLFFGSLWVGAAAVLRIFSPQPVDHSGMLLFAAVGFSVNLAAAFFTKDGESINQRAVNLHMLEDVLGWAVLLAGAVVIRFTGLYIIDPILSLCVAIFILINAAKSLKDVLYLFLERVPQGINVSEIEDSVCALSGVISVHHIHIRSLDGVRHYATMHVKINGEGAKIKAEIKEKLKKYGICHSVLELEGEDENCSEPYCVISEAKAHHHHHHHH